MGRLDGKVALITGAASGIGRGMAVRFAAEGAKVILTDMNEEGIREAAAEIGENAIAVPLNVTDKEAWENAVKTGEKKFGNITVLVNNAGYAPTANVEGTTPEMLQKAFDINVMGTYYGIHSVLESMKRAGGGSIINTITAGIRHMNGGYCFAYVSTKAGVLAATKASAQALAKYNIRVNGVSPGATRTPMLPKEMEELSAKQIPMGRIGMVEDIVNVGLALASDEFCYVSGQDIDVDGAYSATTV